MRCTVQWLMILIVSGTSARPALAQHGPIRTGPEPTGASRISGRVIAADNAALGRRLQVTLSGVPTSELNAGPRRAYVSRDAETDDNGAFDFAGLPGGYYIIQVPPANGFVGLRRGREVTIADGRALDFTLRIERTGAIAGRLEDANGDPVVGADVRAVRRSSFDGHVALQVRGREMSTNDLGEYRLFNLPPGEYLVVAAEERCCRSHDGRRRSGFAPTFYPGSPAVREARAVVVRGGQDTAGINFTLTQSALAKVVVEAVDSGGVPLGDRGQATLNLNFPGDVYLSSSMRSARRQDGRLVFDNVPPGDYYLIVSKGVDMEEAAYVDVKIDGDATLKVQTNTGATVSGRFVIQGRPLDDRAFPNVIVSANPPFPKYGPSYAKVPLADPRGIDRFELTGLRGPMVLHAELGGGALVSIQRGGENLAGKTLHFTGTEVIDDLVVVVTTDVAAVDVTVTDASAKEDPETVLVVLFSEDPARWHPGYLQQTTVHASAPQSTGAADPRQPEPPSPLHLQRMVPGRYLIAAIPDPEMINPADRRMLEKLRPLAVPVTLVAGKTAKVDVRVARPAH